MSTRALVLIALLSTPAAAGPASAPLPEPGRWRFMRTFVDIALPGVPASATRERLNVPRTWHQCIPAAAVDTLYDGLLGNGCRATRTFASGGRMRVTGTCGDGRLEFAGIAAPRRITGILIKNGNDGSYLKAQLTLDRVGTC